MGFMVAFVSQIKVLELKTNERQAACLKWWNVGKARKFIIQNVNLKLHVFKDGYYTCKIIFVGKCLLSFALLLGCLFYFGVVLKFFEAFRYFVKNQMLFV